MSDATKIEWTDATFNPWTGCERISPACDFCYAASWAKRTGQADLWEGNRRRTTADYWKQPIRWNREAAKTGYRRWVFCASLADVFDNQVPPDWRTDLWALIKATPLLRWQLLTKRIGNVEKMLPDDWRPSDYAHVGFMATIANQQEADRDLGKLTDLKRRHEAAWIGISYEPALGPLLLLHWLGEGGLDWVVAGAESGPNARPAHPDWFRSVRDQCAATSTPFLFKQWGEYVIGRLDGDEFLADEDCVGPNPTWGADRGRVIKAHGCEFRRVGKKLAGRLLDGREWNEMPSPRTETREAA